MWKNKVDPDRPQNTIRRMLISCCIKATNAIKIHSSYCFSMETMVSQKHINVKLIRPLLVLLVSEFLFYFTTFFLYFCHKTFQTHLEWKIAMPSSWRVEQSTNYYYYYYHHDHYYYYYYYYYCYYYFFFFSILILEDEDTTTFEMSQNSRIFSNIAVRPSNFAFFKVS